MHFLSFCILFYSASVGFAYLKLNFYISRFAIVDDCFSATFDYIFKFISSNWRHTLRCSETIRRHGDTTVSGGARWPNGAEAGQLAAIKASCAR